MTGMSFAWRLAGHGWADCTVADEHAEAGATASYISAAPEELLTAVTRLIAGEQQARAQFEAEPGAYRWIFRREGNEVSVRLLQLPDSGGHDEAGTELWSTRQATDTLARAIIRGFDQVAHACGESGYRDQWGSPFPRTELEALRNAWRAHRAPGRPGP